MMNYYTVLGIFDHVDYTAGAIAPLEKIEVKTEDIKIMSVAPYPNGTFIDDVRPTPIWLFALAFGLIGFGAGILLAGGTQWMMNLNVGAKAPVSIPVVAVICYELSLLGAVVGTFAGLLWMTGLPNWNERVYDDSISHGNLGLLVRCWEKEQVLKVEEIFGAHKALKIRKGENDF